ncbi:MAG: polyprenyl diphosphate synthase [bacterium]|nr:polyprenyl diphosphate synthase [bacterium]
MNTGIPTHIAIIPDGNRRWASEHGVSPLDGYKQGAEVLRAIMPHAADAGVKYISIWGMSLDNFTKRSISEVAGLLSLFRSEFHNLATSDDIHRRKVKINVFGRWEEKFPKLVKSAIQKAINATSEYTDHHMNFFLAYNGVDEMTQAIQTIIASGVQTVTPEIIKQHLFTKDLPPVDLIIRTGGEPHLSAGFMMWDVTDSQLWFTEKLWPAFTEKDLDEALEEYSKRQRRKGA